MQAIRLDEQSLVDLIPTRASLKDCCDDFMQILDDESEEASDIESDSLSLPPRHGAPKSKSRVVIARKQANWRGRYSVAPLSGNLEAIPEGADSDEEHQKSRPYSHDSSRTPSTPAPVNTPDETTGSGSGKNNENLELAFLNGSGNQFQASQVLPG